MDKQTIDSILNEFYRSKSAKTSRLYRSDLDAFRNYLGVGNVQTALFKLFESPHSQANLTVLHYKSIMQREGLKSATVNRRLSALRSLTKEAHRNGILSWKLDVSNERLPPGHKSMPLGAKRFEAMLEKAGSQRNPLKAARDTAILRLLHDLAMQRSSIVCQDISDIDFSRNTISVTIPGSADKISKRLPSKTSESLQRWLSYRGAKKGPLFTNCDHAGKGKRLTGTSIYRIVRQLGKEIGVETGPFGIRQTAIIKALDKARSAGFRVSDVAAFSDHRHLSSLKTYEKQRAHVQSCLSDLISE